MTMEEDRLTEVKNSLRSRAKDRDQRMPTFHMLVDHDKHHHQYHFHHQAKREQQREEGNLRNSIGKRKSPTKTAANFEKIINTNDNDNEKTDENINSSASNVKPSLRRRPPRARDRSRSAEGLSSGIHKQSESTSSVGSCRTPACNFSQFYVNSAEESAEFKVKPPVPERQERMETPKTERFHYQQQQRRSPAILEEDLLDEEEPADVVVWNPITKTTVRPAHHHQPITNADIWQMPLKSLDKNSNTVVRRNPENERRARSSSLPHSNARKNKHPELHQKLQNLGLTSSLLLNTGDMRTDLLDVDSMSPLPVNNDTNDVPCALGDDISNVNFENEKLKKEIDHVRSQNGDLLKAIQETTEELERLKRIFRAKGIPIPNQDMVDSLIKSPKGSKHSSRSPGKDRDRARSTSPQIASDPSIQLPGKKAERRRSRHRSKSKKRDNLHDNNGNEEGGTTPNNNQRPTSPRQSHNRNSNNHNHNKNGDESFDLKSCRGRCETHVKRSRKKHVDEDSDNEDDKLTNGCYLGLNILVNHDDVSNSSSSYNRNVDDNFNSPGTRRRRRSQSRDNKRDGDGGSLSEQQPHHQPRGGENNKSPRRNRSQHKIHSSPGINSHLTSRENSKQEFPPGLGRVSVQPQQRGCVCRMFSCCYVDPPYQKDYDDDMSILQDYRQ